MYKICKIPVLFMLMAIIAVKLAGLSTAWYFSKTANKQEQQKSWSETTDETSTNKKAEFTQQALLSGFQFELELILKPDQPAYSFLLPARFFAVPTPPPWVRS